MDVLLFERYSKSTHYWLQIQWIYQNGKTHMNPTKIFWIFLKIIEIVYKSRLYPIWDRLKLMAIPSCYFRCKVHFAGLVYSLFTFFAMQVLDAGKMTPNKISWFQQCQLTVDNFCCVTVRKTHFKLKSTFALNAAQRIRTGLFILKTSFHSLLAGTTHT